MAVLQILDHHPFLLFLIPFFQLAVLRRRGKVEVVRKNVVKVEAEAKAEAEAEAVVKPDIPGKEER